MVTVEVERWKVRVEGLCKIGEEKWIDICLPMFTDLCGGVRGAAWHAVGEELPTYVKRCQTHVLKFGELDELAKDLTAKGRSPDCHQSRAERPQPPLS